MTITVAVVGKGGTGKTTVAALTIKYLLETGRTPILAIDGDPSSNLNLALGMELRETIGQIREDTKKQVSSGTFQEGMSKPDWFEYKVNECLVEGEGVDLLAMGRPEGPTCYCAANNMLRNSIDALGNDYDWVVIDNEAGMEHISRQTTRDVDVLFIVTDPTYRGLAAAQHIVRLVGELGTRIGRSYLLVNNVTGDLPEAFCQQVQSLGVPLLGTLPRDPAISAFDLQGRPLVELDEHSQVYPALQALLRQVLG
ncbi:MAG: AAA family ATPase [Chloroflexi bacterium]|jgi:CO dehydrogenase maturation factor|nr:AAA family ATPase [Chloroflexota bacterium]